MAFYSDQEIKPELPVITGRRDNVTWTLQEAARLHTSSDATDRKIARIITESIGLGVREGAHQVFLLSAPKDRGHSGHKTLARAVPHHGQGRGSAFVQKQRYISSHALETASSTDDLVR